MKNYEVTAVLKEGSSIVEETKNAIKDILSRNSAEISSEEDWGSKKIWHKINGQETGFFAHWKCKANPAKVAQIKAELLLNENILRSLVVTQN
ncbi:MAG: 30S ribosomal protein S6 [Leptospiraceae bacterium]|nr:30S ribosomal protein S6 [Leptospiraceae bacterium]MCK6380873.1 30S ribosomal protein S6 [Leptospiraceae bacterium]NUM41285.1 30S ribosomal protein S6 [Leptospiraceae bacterium]